MSRSVARRLTAALGLFALAATSVLAQSANFEQGRVLDGPGHVLPHRDRVEPFNRMLEERLNELLPRLMRETGIDMWLVINREYNEDPVFFSLVPRPVFAARRTTMLVFFDRGPDHGGVELLTVNRYPYGALYESAWEGGDLEEQWLGLGEVIAARDPRRIGVNVSRHWPVADGLSAALHERLLEVLTPELEERVTSAEELVVRWIETRSPLQMEAYPQIVSLARGVIAEAFSERVITAGATTTDDVVWYIAQRFRDLGLDIWFLPSVNAQRRASDGDEACDPGEPFCGGSGAFVIQRGDVLHTDVGICYVGLCTDTQEMGYVLRLGESEAPAELQAALAAGNRWQDILTGEFRTGRTGNEILAATISVATDEGLRSSTYTHPLGVFGHAPGPTIGMWDNQGPTPIRGDWPLYPDTAYAIEGNVKVELEMWGGQDVQIKLEQSAVYDGEQVLYLAGRQTEWHLVH
ncbi:MAG: aminopeptidase P family protein [Holophagales bacterium]|nr:aminopeptidase P family protein [Holophagales bacterium]MYG29574.1 aminopeptidase P family protein [Holophagales bacterium]MYI79908.1 aminopeptidase P family protein [Holophagales bacterium]